MTDRERQDKFRKCILCKKQAYFNATPVSVIIVPLYIEEKCQGVLVGRRAGNPDAPGNGGFAFIAGHQAYDESSQQAAARELREETGLETDPEELKLYWSAYSQERHVQLTYWEAPGMPVSVIENFRPTHECSELQVCDIRGIQLAFPLHQTVLKMYLHKIFGAEMRQKLHAHS